MASTRLPGKPLADLGGRPMIVRVCEQAAAADVGRVVVAAAELEVCEAVSALGFEAVLTDPALPSGSDRVHSALEEIDPGAEHDVVVNLQGDMPTLDPASLPAVLSALQAGPGFDIATLVAEITDLAERDDPNVVKAILSMPSGGGPARALYFTRATAPWGEGPLWHHVGVYAYRRPALARFVAAPPSPLERRERLEQLRALELGLTIGCAVLEGPAPIGIDTPADLEAVRSMIARQEV